MPEISIILPIYNAENYIVKCIESILSQTFYNFELIIVNDGSVDRSLEVCENYKKYDERIKVISKKNEGVSIARNTALEVAKGKYIFFIDADDYVDSRILEKLFILAEENNLDFCMCNYINEKDNNLEMVCADAPKILVEKRDIINLLFNFIEREDGNREHNLGKFRAPWGKLFRKNIIDKYNIRFNIDLKIGEDFLFILEFLKNSYRFGSIKEHLYYYVNNNNSALNEYKVAIWENDYKKIIIYLNEFLIKSNFIIQSEEKMNKLVIKYYLLALRNEKKSKLSKKDKKEIINYIKKLNRDELIKNSLNMCNLKDYSIKDRIIIIVSRCKLYLVIYYLIFN